MRDNVGFVFAVFAIIAALLLGGLFGYKQGAGMALYERGIEYGVQTTIATVNHLLEDAQTNYFIRYTPEDQTYHLVLKQRQLKREYPRRSHGTQKTTDGTPSQPDSLRSP